MIRAPLLSGLLLPAVLACTPVEREAVARDAARSVVTRVVVDRFPGVPVQPSIDCVIDNATLDEIVSLASHSVTGPNAAATQTVAAIATRASTLECLTREGLPALLQQDQSIFGQ